MEKIKFFMILVSLVIIAVFSGTVSAANWTVNPGGSIQAVINNASVNDTITVNDNNGSYTYTENVVINKKLSLQTKTGGNVTLQGLDSSKPIITVNSLGSGTTIQGFKINGTKNSNGIYLNGVSNCNINENRLTNNNIGIYLSGGSNNQIKGNIVNENTCSGISIFYGSKNNILNNIIGVSFYGINLVYSSNNTIQNNTAMNISFGIDLQRSSDNVVQNSIFANSAVGVRLYNSNNNTIHTNAVRINYAGIYIFGSSNNNSFKNNMVDNNQYGMYLYNVVNINNISGNAIINNQYGVYLFNSSTNINFNRITGNSRYGLYKTGNGTVNATNNWWGSNNPTVASASGSDICAVGGTVTHNSWLILNVVNPSVVINTNSTVTIDLNHSNAGIDTVSQGNIPDTAINLTSTLGSIASTFTKNGKAVTTFNRDKVVSGTANITIILDNQRIQTNITILANIPLDTIMPKVTASLDGGVYNTTKSVTLTASDNSDMNPVVFYSLNNGTTWISSIKTVTLNLGQGKTDLKFYAADSAGNICPTQTISYTIDLTAPTVTASLPNGTYTTYQGVILTATDNFSTNPTIYYTLDGTTPTTAGVRYTNPINIAKNSTVLKFMAVDAVGNQAQVQNRNYIINLPISNINTGKVYLRIQDAIDEALSSDIIQVNNGTYIENINLNKKLTLQGISGGNVIIKALNQSKPVLFVNSGGSGSTIKWFTVKDNTNSGSSGIYVGAQNCTINENTLTNNYHGIVLYNSSSTTISGNTLTNNNGVGIYLIRSENNTLSKNAIKNNGDGICLVYYSANNKIFGNTLLNNKFDGIYLDFSDRNKIYVNNLTNNGFDGIEIGGSNNSTIYGNTIASNTINGLGIYGSYGTSISGNNIKSNGAVDGLGEDGTFNGIYLVDSSATINYNIIAGNQYHGIYNKGTGIVNATNNFWNSNTPLVSSNNGNDIYIAGGTVNYSPWCSYGTEISRTNVIQAAESVKTYIETNHQLPLSINVVGTQVSMPQFLKLLTQAVLDINNNTQSNNLVLGLGGYWCMPTEEKITNGVMLDTEYISIANSTKSFMDSNGCAPNYMYYTSLGSLMGFESLVYMYSQILSFYKINQTLPASINITPWLAVKNPNGTYNFRTNKVFATIQAAIDDAGTQNGDTITLGKSTYSENVIIKKTLAIEPLFTGIKVNAASPNLPVFTIEINGSSSLIENLIITGSGNNTGVLINNSSNNTVLGNNLTGNYNGICISNSMGNNIAGNTISNNNLNGISVQTSFKNIFSTNMVKNNGKDGIYVNNSNNNTICSNTISNNLLDGIYFNNSSANVSFNRIAMNSRYGLYNEGNGTINAQNNWWGSNNPIISSNSTSDICIGWGIVTCDQWLVLNVTSSIDRSNRTGKCYNNLITADLNHNNRGDDTSKNGDALPDGIPVSFTVTLGAINNSVSTRKGRATATLSSSVIGVTNFAAVLDRQKMSNTANMINITNLAIRNNRTNEGFTSIQAAINDTDTLNGDIIFIDKGIYTENVVINKTITLRPVLGQDVTVQAYDESKTVFLIVGGGNGSKIQDLKITGASDSYGVALSSASNCNISNNIITGNYRGIYFYLSNNNTIYDNNIKNNYYGIATYNSTGNHVSRNGITNCYYGICLINSNSTKVTGNNIRDNWDGIQLYNSMYNNFSNNTVKGNWLGINLCQSNSTNITGNLVTGNGGGISSYDSNSTQMSGNNITNNWLTDTSIVDPARMVMATTIYTCGPAALATVMKHLEVNATEEELARLAGTDETGTTIYGLVQAAKYKGLNATGFRLNIDKLKTDYIVVLKINGNYHYNIIRNVTNTTVYLTDPNLGDIEMSLAKFKELYTGYVLVIANGSIQINATVMTEEEMRNIKAMRIVIDYATISIPYIDWMWVPKTIYVISVGIQWIPLKFWGWTVGWIPIPYFYWKTTTIWVPVPVVRFHVITVPSGWHWEPDPISVGYVSHEYSSEKSGKTVIGHFGNFANSWLMEGVNSDIYDSLLHDEGISHRHFDWKEGIIIGGGIILAIPTEGLSLVAIGRFVAAMALMAWDNPGPFWQYHYLN